jgi:hypothetical protein
MMAVKSTTAGARTCASAGPRRPTATSSQAILKVLVENRAGKGIKMHETLSYLEFSIVKAALTGELINAKKSLELELENATGTNESTLKIRQTRNTIQIYTDLVERLDVLFDAMRPDPKNKYSSESADSLLLVITPRTPTI